MLFHFHENAESHESSPILTKLHKIAFSHTSFEDYIFAKMQERILINLCQRPYTDIPTNLVNVELCEL
jgi:hypothetical protein